MRVGCFGYRSRWGKSRMWRGDSLGVSASIVIIPPLVLRLLLA